MRIFMTGATGFIGTRLIGELHGAGHQVLGLARSDAGAKALAAAGVEVHRGDLQDVESLRRGAAQGDAVIHLGFVHDFSRFEEVCAVDRLAIDALGSALEGSSRPLIITSGVGMGSTGDGRPAVEDVFDAVNPNPRAASEVAGAVLSARGVNVRVMRLPQVHDPLKQGLITPLIELNRAKGVSAYVGDGGICWPAAHLDDTARLYRLALEKGVAGGRYHAVAEEGVAFKDIAESIGRGLKIPVVSLSPQQAAAHFGWLAMFANLDMKASSALTRARLGWHPTGPGLIADLDRQAYVNP